jgi:AcrR family transcriptional regulator
VSATAAQSEAVETGLPTGARDSVVRHLGADDRSSTRVRLVDGALECLARQGIAKTTVDDIARAAGLSRATAYRTFPRGKEGILAGVVETEVARLFSSLAVAMGEANDLEDVLVAGMVASARWLCRHEPLTYLLEHEPGAVLPYITFGGFDRVMRVASDLAAPFFARWLEPEQASRAAEWGVRIVMAYTSDPSPHADLTDPADTRALVRTFVLPGILALRVEAARTPPGPASTSTSTSDLDQKQAHDHAARSIRPTTKGAAQ